ncbi:thioredoxin family protein [Aquimarina sp. 2201CG1-2-11]|uniref:thioredoxin family protein n=1 Tax=Aquimarina discodermiae TaxID=3231043 RepID=UPI0034618A1A
MFFNKKNASLLIDFQNYHEKKFRNKKSIKNLFYFIFSVIIFFVSTLLAQIMLPYNLIKRIIKKPTLIVNVKVVDFYKIIEKHDNVVVYFWAEWCGPCQLMQPFLKEFSGQTLDVKVIKVHASQQELMKKFNIKGIPQVLLFKGGQNIKRNIGPMTLEDLKEFVK